MPPTKPSCNARWRPSRPEAIATSTSQPGHHQTAIQTLPLTLAVDNGTVIVLDALRKQRHLTDYTGDGVSEALLAECIAQAESLLRHARAALGDP